MVLRNLTGQADTLQYDLPELRGEVGDQMNVVIIDKVAHPKGILFTFDKKGKQVKILFLTHDIEAEMEIMLKDLIKYKHRIEARAHALIPDIRWDGSRKKVNYLESKR
jgi:hypothetical protein